MLFQEGAEHGKKLFIRIVPGSGVDDCTGSLKKCPLHNGWIYAFSANPHFTWIDDSPLLKLERYLVKNIVADVFFVGQDLMDRRSRPAASQICQYSLPIQHRCDLAFGSTFVDEHSIHLSNDFQLLRWAFHKHHTVGLQALSFTACEFTFGVVVLVDQNAAKPVAWRAALAEAKLDQPALSGEDLH